MVKQFLSRYVAHIYIAHIYIFFLHRNRRFVENFKDDNRKPEEATSWIGIEYKRIFGTLNPNSVVSVHLRLFLLFTSIALCSAI